MSKMIQCDHCKKIMYEDSRSDKDDYHELWIDRTDQLHICKDCYVRLLETFFPFMMEEV